MSSKIYILMGVSATGKTTLGNALAQTTGGKFYDGDDYHPESNRQKMSAGIALTDEDRQPWLEIIADLAAKRDQEDSPSFIACSALKESYRITLRSKVPDMNFLHLHTNPELLHQRIKERFEAGEHFMPPSLLKSQLDALELPDYALLCDVSKPLEEIVQLVLKNYPQLIL